MIDRLQFCRDIGVCIATGVHGHVDPAHTRYSDSLFGKFDAGIALKPHDAYTVPLSRDAHEEQHSGGEREFWTRHGFRAGSITEGPLAAGLVITGFWIVRDIDAARAWVIERAKLGRAWSGAFS